MGLFSRREIKKQPSRPAPDDNLLAKTLSQSNRTGVASSSNLGLDKLDADQKQVLTYLMLDRADFLGDDDELVNIVDKVEDEGSGGSDSDSDSDDDEATKASKRAQKKLVKQVQRLAGAPPRYNSLAPLAPRYRIVPREEEGHEKLPGYRSVIYREGLLERKAELNSPFDEAANRKWVHVHVELNNTKLSIYSVSSRIGRNNKRVTDSLTEKSYKVKNLIKTYSLQYADIGLAPDYSKKPNCIRIRAEGEQFILSTATELDCVEWVRNLQMGAEIALPLEERKLPKLRSIPRRRHGRRRRREQLEEARMSRDLMLRPYSSRMSTASVSSTFSRPNRTPSRARGSSSGTETGAVHFNSSANRRSSVHFHTPAHPRRYSQPANSHMNSSNPSSALSPMSTRSSWMYDDDFSDEEEDVSRHSTNRSSITTPIITTTSPTAEVTPSLEDDDDNTENAESEDVEDNTSASAGGSELTSTSSSIQEPDDEDQDAEDDDEADQNALRQINTQATTTSMTFTFGYKWNPAKLLPTQAALIKYARRCLAQLPEDTPWLNKKIVKDGAKYLVHENKMEKISATVVQ